MTSSADQELRGVVKFCVGLGKSPKETIDMINSSSTTTPCSKSFVYKWHGRFSAGRLSLKDDPREGRPANVMTSVLSSVREILNKDRRVTVRSISEDLGVSCSTIHHILTQDLGMSKISARWVPRLLKDCEKERRVQCSTEFLRRLECEGERFLDRIITVDETWIHHFDPETKQESAVWKTPKSPVPKKARVQRSVGKEMFIYFMDRRGMVLEHKVRDGCTVNAEYYAKVLRRDLVDAIRRKRPGLNLSDVIFHQDNAPAHRAASTMLEISLLDFQVLEHPPYSPDLAPMDFRVFPEIKAFLRGRRFENVHELRRATRDAVRALTSEWYRDTFNMWVSRHRKCVAINGGYVEKVRRSLDL